MNSMQNRFTRLTATASLLALLAGCASSGTQSDSGMGTLGGAGLGGAGTFAGCMALKHDLKTCALVASIGAVIGGLAGHYAFDAQDRTAQQQATQQSLQTNAAVSWQSKSDVYGRSEITGNSTDSNGVECKTVREVALVKGEEQSKSTRYCRQQNNGAWRASAS
ncbi:MAG: hypothetical protein U1F76_10865 [Candidatus Competibacteraceae bacterium]